MVINNFLFESSKLVYVSNTVSWFVFSVVCLLVPSAFGQNTELATKTEKTVGLTLLNYKYNEPSYMTLKANKIGIDFSGTYALGSEWPNSQKGWFVKGEFETLSGNADYQSPFSGAISNTPNRSVEVRGLVGKDFQVGVDGLTTYIGLGYRHFYSNIGYDRTSIYKTLPIGVTYKMTTSGQSKLHTTAEYLHLMSGKHKVKLLTQNVSLDQTRGYGLKVSVMHLQEAWSMGPTLTYWKMPHSEVDGFLPVYEPQNTTLELGFKATYRF
jgi:hypothetical protein